MFSIDQFSLARPSVMESINCERLLFSQEYNIIETIIKSDAHCITSGDLGICLITGQKRSLFVYHLFSSNALRLGNSIANALADSEHPIAMRTLIPYTKYEISVNARAVVILNTIMIKPELLIPTIKPIMKSGWVLMPPMFHLLELYRKLYSPHEAESWEECIYQESLIFPVLHSEFPKKSVVTHVLKKKYSSVVKNLLDYSKSRSLVLIGEYAVVMMSSSAVDNRFKLAFIYSDPVEIDAMATVLRRFSQDVQISSGGQGGVIGDPRFTRISIKMDGREVVYMHNSGEYDLIPYSVHAGIKIANVFVVMRFLLVEIWTVRRIESQGKIDINYANSRIKDIIASVLLIHDYAEGLEIDQLFSLKNYLGSHVSEQNYAKKQVVAGKKFMDYLPQGYRNEFHDLRKI